MDEPLFVRLETSPRYKLQSYLNCLEIEYSINRSVIVRFFSYQISKLVLRITINIQKLFGTKHKNIKDHIKTIEYQIFLRCPVNVVQNFDSLNVFKISITRKPAM